MYENLNGKLRRKKITTSPWVGSEFVCKALSIVKSGKVTGMSSIVTDVGIYNLMLSFMFDQCYNK